ncbi:DUF2125 domain-containing protein [Roseicyclus persicicus]|uniref:DUF2125 domain-containing protein n=1 Tax=Roseicyclus persicicus TaxID=2650661 RepID=A0A7X6JYY1_9RHOB|nr:DUF2125 domain-containing protein [Roseibacterium persicicum]NKX44233.1 DUF2125 domain-containing protein [Roseibacterium persicicum]
MKRLLGGLVGGLALAAAAWVGWAMLTERTVVAWLDAREAEGWVVTREAVSVGGFPTAFVTRFDGLSLADPATGLVWSAPVFTVRQAAWDLSRMEAVWPAEHALASPFERLTIRAAELAAVLDVQPAAQLALDASETRMRDLSVDSTLGWRAHLAAGRIEMLRQEGTEATYSLRFEATELTPPEDVARALDPAGVLPAAIPVVRSDAVVTFDRRWDLSAIEVSRPQPVRIELSEARAEWGTLMLRMSGTVDVDAEGRPTGEVAIRAENWPEMLAMAERGGLLTETARRAAERALGFLSGLSGRAEDLDVTLRMADGFLYLGPLPIGEGPRLRLR